MVGGIIIDWYKRNDGNTEFLVRGTGCEQNDFCCVTASIPERVFREIKEDDSIWWQSGDILLKVLGVSDVAFPKIGASGDGVREFYKRRAA